MSTPRSASPKSRPRAAGARLAVPSSWARWGDVGLVAAFLGLVFLLGAFPLFDTDHWWHLRTGDWIRQHWRVPTHDLYTYTVPDNAWIDLHWGYQIGVSWIYQLGGVKGLNLAKCSIVCASMLLLVSARRREWPVWVALLSWMPALCLLSGRMYVRPETVSLLYLAADLAILFRWKQSPRLAYALPLIQLFWVNTQGLFVLGPVVIGMALVDAALMPGAWGPAMRPWWRTVWIACALTMAACVLNPYGIEGALFPIELARTMSNPIFHQSIAELMPIRDFIRTSMGFGNFMLRVQIATFFLGALSFLLPLFWYVGVRIANRRRASSSTPLAAIEGPRKGKGTKRAGKGAGAVEPLWRPSPFRWLLFIAFSALGWQALRNSNQFATVVGTVTAWNFAEWAVAIRRRREGMGRPTLQGAAPRVLTLACIVAAFVAVASGGLYALAGESRTVGLGERPLWYPREAVRFAGREGMPKRFLAFHNGHFALYEYEFGPERKVFADARLEVIGPDLYARYLNLQERIRKDDPEWNRELEKDGRPVVLVDNLASFGVGVTMLASSRWRCVHFDPIASVFLHEADRASARVSEVDFLGRHFLPDPSADPHDVPSLHASALGLWNYAFNLSERGRPDLARRLLPLGQGYTRRILRVDPTSVEAWKVLGQLEAVREPTHRLRFPARLNPGKEQPRSPMAPRFRMAMDPVFDLSPARVTYAFQQVLRRNPDDVTVLFSLCESFLARGMNEAAVPILERLARVSPINQTQNTLRDIADLNLEDLRTALGPEPTAIARANASELERMISERLMTGRAESAAEVIDREYPAERRPWPLADRLATLRIHLGEPEQARRAWLAVANPPRPAVRAARVAFSYLVEEDFERARRGYLEAIAIEPYLFEALYGLAVLEHDAGRAAEAVDAARRALKGAPGDAARSALSGIIARTEPYAARP